MADDLPSVDEILAAADSQEKLAIELRAWNDMIDRVEKLPLAVAQALLKGAIDAAEAYVSGGSSPLALAAKRLAESGLKRVMERAEKVGR
jgi:hypothetical protein